MNLVKRALNLVVDLRDHRHPRHAEPAATNSTFDNWVVDVIVVIVVTTLVGAVVNVGFDWWESMVYDKRWEFSTMTRRTFFSDLAKGLPHRDRVERAARARVCGG